MDLDSLQDEAAAGGIEAQLQLADIYEHGIGVPVDRGKAVEWYRRGGPSRSC